MNIAVQAFRLRTHNGCITIENPGTGQHRTFRIETVIAPDSVLYGKRIVSLLIGSNNESDYRGFGFVNGDHIILWKRCREGDYPKYARLLEHPDEYATRKGLRYHIEGTCRQCNRKLTVPESIETGLGPVCGQRAGKPHSDMRDTRSMETEMTIDITHVLITHDDNGGLMCDHSDLRGQLAVGYWPMHLTLVGDDEPKTFTRLEHIPMGDDLGGFIYRAEDGTRMTIFND